MLFPSNTFLNVSVSNGPSLVFINMPNILMIDTLIVEFKQYPERSNMRRIMLSRKNGEQGDRAGGGGFYGGIRKLYSVDEIETWNKLFLLVTNVCNLII